MSSYFSIFFKFYFNRLKDLIYNLPNFQQSLLTLKYMIDHGEHVSHVMHALYIMKVRVTNRHFIPANVCHCLSELRAHAAGKPHVHYMGFGKPGEHYRDS